MRSLAVKSLSRAVLPLLVATGALVGFALGLLGAFYPAFDMAAQFTAHWLIIALVALGASFAARRTYVMLVAGFALACLFPAALTAWHSGAATITPAYAGSVAAAPLALGRDAHDAKRRRFKLLSYNTYNLNTDLDAIWREIERHDADVVVLLEFGPNKRALRRRLAARFAHQKACDQNWDCAIGVFSRLPILAFRLVGPRDDDGPPFIAADIALGGTTVRIIATHILSPNDGPRANFTELDRLAAIARQSPLPLVVAGDLNTTLWANAFDHFRRKSGLSHMGALIPTWPVKPIALPQLGIDHVFMSRELRLVDISVGGSGGSDHLPLAATIELR